MQFNSTIRIRGSWAAVFLLVLAVGGCSKSSADRAQLPPPQLDAPAPVRVVQPASALASGDTKVTGNVRSIHEATLAAKTTAQILKLDVRVGDRVKKGQVLARLDATMASISLQNSRAAERLALANLTNSRAELDRGKALHEQGALADSTFDKLEMAFSIASAQADQAHASARAASQQISDSAVTAPFDGVVSARYKNPGDTVSAMPPTPLLALVDPDNLEVRMSVPEALAPMLHPGDSLPAIASPSGTPFQVRVSTLGAAVDPLSRTIEVLADVLPPIDPLLRSGTLATVDTSSAAAQGLYLPASAVQTTAGTSWVLVAVADKLQRREVKAAQVKPGTALVSDGLAANDAVVLEPANLKDGAVVRVVEE